MFAQLSHLAQSAASQPLPAPAFQAFSSPSTDYGPLPAILFYAFALLTALSAFAVPFSRNIVRAAVALLFALAGMAGLYFLLRAEFLAAVQLVVYVGGTLILMIFGVMLTSKSPSMTYQPKKAEVLAASLVAAAIAASLIYLFLNTPWNTAPPPSSTTGPTIENLGEALLSGQSYLVPFELVSVLLLAVMIGAAYLAKGRRPTPPHPTNTLTGRGANP